MRVQREAHLNHQRQRLLPGTFTNPVLSPYYVPGCVLGEASNEKVTLLSSFRGGGVRKVSSGQSIGSELLAQQCAAAYFTLHTMPEETEAQGAQETGSHGRRQDLS